MGGKAFKGRLISYVTVIILDFVLMLKSVITNVPEYKLNEHALLCVP